MHTRNTAALRRRTAAFAALLFAAAGCHDRAPASHGPPSSRSCVALAHAFVPSIPVCRVEPPLERRSGHPYHPDLERVRVGADATEPGATVVVVESYRVYSVEHLILRLDLDSGRIVRDEHRVGWDASVVTELPTGAAASPARDAAFAEMRAVVERIERGGRDGEHQNRAHPELVTLVRLLDAARGR